MSWVSDSVFRKKIEGLNRDYINANSETNKKGEIFLPFLPAYDDLVNTDFETIYDNLVDTYEKAGVKMLFVINPKTKWQLKETRIKGKTYYQLLENLIIPETDIDYSYYEEYVRRLVSRYGNRVAGWFIFNEPSGNYLEYFPEEGSDKGGGSNKGKGSKNSDSVTPAVKHYTKLVESTYPIIKSINPDAIVILGGAGAIQEVDFYADVLVTLYDMKNNPDSLLYGTGGFDAWDYHSYAVASEYKKIWAGNNRMAWGSAPDSFAKYRDETYRFYELYRDVLDYSGFVDKPLISKEGATYTGEDPYLEKPGGSGRLLALQDEVDQAAFLVKRSAHLLSKGVKLINWSTILEHINYKNDPNNFFNYTGLLYNGMDNGIIPDPGDMIPKLSFYTYNSLTLQDADWSSFLLRSSSPISSDSNFDVSVYEFKNTVGETKFIAWVDYYYYDNETDPTTRLELQLPVAVSLDLSNLAGQQVKVTKAIPNAGETKLPEPIVKSVSQNGVLEIELNKEPVYIELNQP